MKTKIAILGSDTFCQQATRFVEKRNDIELDLYTYKIPEEATELLKQLKPCDALLFSGSLPYSAAKPIVKTIPVPAIYLKQDETEVAVTLLSIALHQHIQLSSLSIDVRDSTILKNVLAASSAGEDAPYMYELQDDDQLETIVDFHVNAHNSKQTTLAVTSVHAVYDRLQALGIRAIQMVNVKSSFSHAIDTLCHEISLQKSETSKLAVGILDITSHDPSDQLIIKEISKLLHAHYIDNEDTVLLYTTQGAIQSALQLPTFQSILSEVAGRIAFGSGHTLTSAKENAVSALHYMKAEDPNGLYLLDEKKDLQNVLNDSKDKLKLRITEPALNQMTTNTALSPAVLSKLILFSTNSPNGKFTANDLAAHLGVSRRTAERTIKKLLAAQYVRTIGEEMTYRQGRPRAVYEFNFPIN